MSLDRLQTMLRYEVVVPNLWEANPHFEGAGDSRDERTSSGSFVVTNQIMAMIVQFAMTSLVLHLAAPPVLPLPHRIPHCIPEAARPASSDALPELPYSSLSMRSTLRCLGGPRQTLRAGHSIHELTSYGAYACCCCCCCCCCWCSLAH